MIQMFHVNKTFGKDLEALVDVDLHIHKGEMVFLVGSNGAGKSTLLRLIFRAELPTSGQVLVNGHNIVRMKPRAVPYLRRTLGIFFQDFKLLRDRTIEENLTLVASVVGMTALQAQRKVAQLLQLVGLSHKAQMMSCELSSGEQQRVAMARALMNDPLILLADEPTGNLDAALAADVMRLLCEINASGTTILVATHDLKLAEEASCRTVLLKQGKIVEEWQRVNRLTGPVQQGGLG